MPKPSSIKFLVDESVEYRIAQILRDFGHNVTSISELSPSISDKQVLQKAYRETRILITNDTGFGRLIFKEKQRAHGVILIRLPEATIEEKSFRLQQVLDRYPDFSQIFVTITAKRIRKRQLLY